MFKAKKKLLPFQNLIKGGKTCSIKVFCSVSECFVRQQQEASGVNLPPPIHLQAEVPYLFNIPCA